MAPVPALDPLGSQGHQEGHSKQPLTSGYATCVHSVEVVSSHARAHTHTHTHARTHTHSTCADSAEGMGLNRSLAQTPPILVLYPQGDPHWPCFQKSLLGSRCELLCPLQVSGHLLFPERSPSPRLGGGWRERLERGPIYVGENLPGAGRSTYCFVCIFSFTPHLSSPAPPD